MWPKLPPPKIASDGASVILEHYPFPRKRTRSIAPADCEALVDWFPLAMFLKNGDIVFLSRERASKVVAFAETNGVPFERRHDMWSMILDPFLDTEYAETYYQQTSSQMAKMGLAHEQVEALRDRLGPKMLLLTAMSWEWQYYGLFDALAVMRPATPFRKRRWQAFYKEAIRIARLGQVIGDAKLADS